MKLLKHHKSKHGALAPVSHASSPWSSSWPLQRLRGDIDRLFDEPFWAWPGMAYPFPEAWEPPVDIYEDKDNVFVKVEIPGIKREDIDVSLAGERLTISGERKEERHYQGAEACQTERFFGRFHRSFPLPAAVEAGKMEAHYKDGILTIACPKTAEAKRQHVEIKVD